jgi:hypothetical protein
MFLCGKNGLIKSLVRVRGLGKEECFECQNIYLKSIFI